MAKEIFVLGSGESINSLTKEEKKHINNASVRIGINKYYAFYKKAEIRPTHVFFYDAFSEASRNMLLHIFKMANRESDKSLTFILQKNRKLHFTQLKPHYFLGKLIVKYNLKKARDKNHNFFYLHRNHKIQLIKCEDWLAGENWAKSLDETLFHYRGSLTSVLNFISISWPNHIIKLVGTDFNGPNYFYEDQLNKLNFKTSDWTTKIIRREGKHFSAIEHEGSTMFDKMDLVVNYLLRTNKIYSCNKNSELVLRKVMPYSSII